ncbi:cell division FtsA domain-containing protein, partial [Patescibacteria group bacterium]|nr:cell division FtsA domain-containing protein [Patescibacteria group bacterium]
MLDIGADSSKLSFVTKYGLNFISVIDLAGNKITSTIGRKLKLTKDRAEDLKKNKGLTNEKIKKALEDNLDEFIREIKMNLKFCGERSGMNIEKIVLTGGGAKMPGLMDYLKEKLGKEVVLGEPQINIVSKDVDLKNALYYEVVGLALRGFEKNYEKTDLNLLAGFIKPSKIGKSSLIPIGKPEKEEKKIQEKPEFKIKKAPKERVIRSGGGNTQKYLLIGLGVVFVALAILVVLRWDSIFGTGDKKKEQTTTEAVEETIQEDVLPALGFNMVVDVDVTGANTVSDGVLLGRLAEVHVNGNEMLVTEEISKQTGQSPADAKLVSQANIEQGKEDLVNKLVEENLENIKKENNFDIVV